MNIELYAHQVEAVTKASTLPNGIALFMETGTGKTFTAMAIIEERERLLYRKAKVLIVCPLSIIESVWLRSLKEHMPNHGAVSMRTKGWANSTGSILVCNFEHFKKIPESILGLLDIIIIDESSKIKSFSAQITKDILTRAGKIPYRIIMSGTPAPNNLLEYWPQVYFIDKSIFNPYPKKTISQNYYSFRAQNFYSFGFGGYQWAPRKEFKEELPKLLARCSFSARKEECLDLPPQVFQTRYYTMNKEQRTAYDTMVKENIVEFKGSVVLGANQLAKIMKTRQITSGFLIDATGKTLDVSDGKMNLLREALDEIGSNQVIIWCQFHWEIERIMLELGDKACAMYGNQSAGEKEDSINDFSSSKKQYLVAHPKTAGHGLNFTNCSYCIYYSLSYSYEEMAQSQDRIHRIGQNKSTTYIYLLAEDSIDDVLYKAIVKKEKISDSILEMINK